MSFSACPAKKKKHMLETAEAIAGLGIDGVKIHLLYVVKGTKMESLYLSGKYRCLEQDEYAELVCDFLELLPEEMVIQRLTGDPHRDELVAPALVSRKSKDHSPHKKHPRKEGFTAGKICILTPFFILLTAR